MNFIHFYEVNCFLKQSLKIRRSIFIVFKFIYFNFDYTRVFEQRET